MSENITINLEGLSNEEREQLLRLIEKAKRPKKIWKPECGEWYWFIDSDGQINNCEWVDDHIDYGRYSMGNCFKTKEEAEFAREKQKVKTELQRFADEHNDLEKLGWNGVNGHHSIRYSYWTNDLVVSCMQQSKDIDCVYFTSTEIADVAVKTVGEKRILKYLFDVDCEVDE